MKHTLIFALTLLVASLTGVSAEPAFPARLDAGAIIHIARTVADWQLAHPNLTQEHGSTDWTEAALYTGMMALHDLTGDDKYLNPMLEMGRQNEWKLGGQPYFADDHAVGQTYGEGKMFFASVSGGKTAILNF